MNVYSAHQCYAHLLPLLKKHTPDACIQESLYTLTVHMQAAEKRLSDPPLKNYFKECMVPLQQKGEMTIGRGAQTTRKLFRASLKDVYSKVIGQYFSSADSILEIGAGEQQTELSRLSSSFKWTFSDFIKPKDTVNTHIQLNLTESPPKHLVHAFKGIVGNNVLDTIAYSDLPLVFRNMGQLLEAEGIIVHFADLSFLAEAFVDACANVEEDSILLPAGPQIKHMYRISKADYEQVLQAKKESLTAEEWKFLSEWGQKPLPLQVAVLSHAQNPAFIYLAERIKSIFENSTMILLESQALFEQHLQMAAQATEWEIVQCNYVSSHEFREQTDDEIFNYCSLKQGNMIRSDSFSVPDYQVKYETFVHVFIAKRQKIKQEGSSLESIEGKLTQVIID